MVVGLEEKKIDRGGGDFIPTTLLRSIYSQWIKWEVKWFNNDNKMMIKYDSDVILRCMVVGWEEKTRRRREIRGILYLSPYYDILSYSLVNMVNKVRDEMIIY